MTNKRQKIKWLKRYELAYYRVKDLEYQLTSEDDLSALVLTESKAESGHYSLDDLLVRRELVREEYNSACEECNYIRQEILDTIKSINDTNIYRVLYLKYIALLDWDTIAERVSYSLPSVYRLHSIGIGAIEIT